MIWFTADTHFGHANIIKYCNRPFASVLVMNAELLNNINDVVKSNDTLYHLGDFAFGPEHWIRYCRSKINCRNVILIPGNHDKLLKKKASLRKDCFQGYYEYALETKFDGVSFTLCHYAHDVWNKSCHGAIHLYAHSHGTLPNPNNRRRLDVGVDNCGYRPISLPEVFQRIKDIPNAVQNC